MRKGKRGQATGSDFEQMGLDVQKAKRTGMSCEGFTRSVVKEWKGSDAAKIASPRHNRETVVEIIETIRQLWVGVN